MSFRTAFTHSTNELLYDRNIWINMYSLHTYRRSSAADPSRAESIPHTLHLQSSQSTRSSSIPGPQKQRTQAILLRLLWYLLRSSTASREGLAVLWLTYWPGYDDLAPKTGRYNVQLQGTEREMCYVAQWTTTSAKQSDMCSCRSTQL